jgi:hypothetical protein
MSVMTSSDLTGRVFHAQIPEQNLMFRLRSLFSCRFVVVRVGRTSEAKDSARVALKSPWWTLGCSYEVCFVRPCCACMPSSQRILKPKS